MTPDTHWNIFEIVKVRPISSFDLSNDEQLKEAFCWNETQPLLKQDHQHKRTIFNFLAYHQQFVKAFQFNKLNDQERLNEDFH